MEERAQETELPVGISQAVTVGEVEYLVGQFECHRLPMQDDSALALQIIGAPNVVVACEEVHLHPIVSEFAHLSQEACEASGDHCGVLEPEVKHVAQHIYGTRLVLYVVKETHQAAFLLPAVLQSATAQMGVTDEIDVLHRRIAT